MDARVHSPRVCLFRSARPRDPFVQALEAAGYDAFCVPVLTVRPVNDATLRARLRTPGVWGGLVLTSPRAAQRVADALDADHGSRDAWRGYTAFVVGTATAGPLERFGLRVVGAESGSAEGLTRLLLERPVEKPLLFLCGNRRRDVLPDRLRAAHVPVEELIVYETAPRETVEASEVSDADWVVYFSPSGVEAASPHRYPAWRRARRAAIGPTTAAALDAAGWRPHAVAARPTPDALVEAMAAAPAGRSARDAGIT